MASSVVESIQLESSSNEGTIQFPEVIELNVGGTLFTTSLKTLRAAVPDIRGIDKTTNVHTLAVMFSGQFEPKKDRRVRYVIDRNPSHFRFILNYLRDGGDPRKIALPNDEGHMRKLRLEAEFYHLEALGRFLDGWNTGSRILADCEENLWRILVEWLPHGARVDRLLYSGSRDGFSASRFHELCDEKGPTLVIIRSRKGNIFGGFSPVSWVKNGGLYPSRERLSGMIKNYPFLFSLKGKSYSPTKHGIFQLVSKDNLGPTFAYKTEDNPRGQNWGLFGSQRQQQQDEENSYTLMIANNCDTVPSKCKLPERGQYAETVLDDEETFLVEEIEVFSVSGIYEDHSLRPRPKP